VLDIGVGGDLDAAAKLLEQVTKRSRRSRSATAACLSPLAKGVEDYSDLPTLLVQGGVKLTVFKEDEINLETAFMALTKGITA
jgi:ABC-2 type transport system ATP-binding protein